MWSETAEFSEVDKLSLLQANLWKLREVLGVLLTPHVSIEPIPLVGRVLPLCHHNCDHQTMFGHLREQAIKLAVHISNYERILWEALVLAQALWQGESTTLAQPLRI